MYQQSVSDVISKLFSTDKHIDEGIFKMHIFTVVNINIINI